MLVFEVFNIVFGPVAQTTYNILYLSVGLKWFLEWVYRSSSPPDLRSSVPSSISSICFNKKEIKNISSSHFAVFSIVCLQTVHQLICTVPTHESCATVRVHSMVISALSCSPHLGLMIVEAGWVLLLMQVVVYEVMLSFFRILACVWVSYSSFMKNIASTNNSYRHKCVKSCNFRMTSINEIPSQGLLISMFVSSTCVFT